MCDNHSAGIAEIVCLFVCVSALTPVRTECPQNITTAPRPQRYSRESACIMVVNTRLKSDTSENEASAEHH